MLMLVSLVMTSILPAAAVTQLDESNTVYGEASYFDIAVSAYSRMLQFKDGVVPAAIAQGQYGLVNIAGEAVVPFRYKMIEVLGNGMFVATDQQWNRGIINAKGETLYPFTADFINKEPDGTTIRIFEADVYRYYDLSLQPVNRNASGEPAGHAQGDYDSVEERDGLLYVEKGGQKGLLSMDGQVLVPLGTYDVIKPPNASGYVSAIYTDTNGGVRSDVYSGGSRLDTYTMRVDTAMYYRDLAKFTEPSTGKVGMMDLRTGQAQKIPANYDDIIPLRGYYSAPGELLGVVETGRQYTYYLFDESGIQIFAEGYDSIETVYNSPNLYKVGDGTAYGIRRSDGSWCIDISEGYQDLRLLPGELVSAEKGGEYYLLRMDGTVTVRSSAPIELFANEFGASYLSELWDCVELSRRFDEYSGTVYPFTVSTGAGVTTCYVDYVNGFQQGTADRAASNINADGLFVYRDSQTGKYGFGQTSAAAAPWANIEAGLPLPQGIQYVPYAPLNLAVAGLSGLQTGREYHVVDSALPEGMHLDSSEGTLHGTPSQAGSFTFGVAVTQDGATQGMEKFTLIVSAQPSDTTAWNKTDQGYEITVAIPNENYDGTNIFGGATSSGNSWSSEWQTLLSQGPYDEFRRLWLDGDELTRGEDYTAEPGSTRLTIRTQTLTSKGEGTHTISAEFRTAQNELRQSTQNYTLTPKGSGSGSGSGSSGSSGGSGSDDRAPVASAVSVTTSGSGTVTPSTASAIPGRQITLTVTPGAGYVLDALTVTGPGGGRLTLTRAAGDKYTFYMPEGAVSVSAVFVPAAPAQPGRTPFLDILESDWFYEPVAQVYERGWMQGVAENFFGPNIQTSRGMLVTILHKLAGNPQAGGSYFSDVPLNQYYAGAAAWAAEQGLVSGYGDGRFGPDDMLTREQMVMILAGYARLAGADTSARGDLAQFNDLDQMSGSARDAMAWAASAGLISGKGNGVLDPAGPATRAEMATVLVKLASILDI